MTKHHGFALSDASIAAEYAMIHLLAGHDTLDIASDCLSCNRDTSTTPIRVFSNVLPGQRTIKGSRLSVESSDDQVGNSTACEYIRYNDTYFLLTADHFLSENRQQVETKPHANEADDDCEIVGLDDFDEDPDEFDEDPDEFDEDLCTEATSRWSRTHSTAYVTESASGVTADPDVPPTIQILAKAQQINPSEQARHIIGQLDEEAYPKLDEPLTQLLDLTGRGIEFALNQGDADDHIHEDRFGGLSEEELEVGPRFDIGFVRVRCAELDYCVIQLDGAFQPPRRDAQTAIDIDCFIDEIETTPRDTTVLLQTSSAALVGGTLSGTPAYVQFPGSADFREVYTATLYRPLKAGDCGSAVRDKGTGRLFGHVVAGSQKTGLALITPAIAVLEHLYQQLKPETMAITPPQRPPLLFKDGYLSSSHPFGSDEDDIDTLVPFSDADSQTVTENSIQGNDEYNTTTQGSQIAKTETKSKDTQYCFACPYWTKDNRRHSICVKYVLNRIRDVKQHLLRRHQMPIYCPVCYDTFVDETTRDSHIRHRACGHAPGEEPEGITATQKHLLSKKIPSNLPEHEQWYRVFNILFPNHRPWPVSPYIQSGLQQNVQAYHDFLSTQGLGILRSFIRNQGLELVSAANSNSKLLVFQDQVLREGLQAVLDQYLSRGGPSVPPASITPTMTSLPTAPNTSTFNTTSKEASLGSVDSGSDQPRTDQLITDPDLHMNLGPGCSLQNVNSGPSSSINTHDRGYNLPTSS
jgi:hypothetical protein